MAIIALSSTKGGVGKTTIAIGLAHALTARGLSVALVDGDPEACAAQAIAIVAQRLGTPIDLSDRSTRRYQLSMPSGSALGLQRGLDEATALDDLDHLAGSNDIVLVDLQGAANQAMLMALSAADLIIVPCQAAMFDGAAALKTINIAKQAGRMARRDIDARVIFSRTPAAIRTRTLTYVQEQLAGQGVKSLRTEWMERDALRRMILTGAAPDTHANGEANAAENLSALAREVSLILQGREAELDIHMEESANVE